MKSIFALLAGLVLMALAANAYTGENCYFATDKGKIYGTWVNMEYSFRAPPKCVYNQDGTIWTYENIEDKYHYTRRYLITRKWYDSKKNIMYRSHWVSDWGEEGYTLSRISNSGNTLEMVSSNHVYPKSIDPKAETYGKYTRK